MTNRNFSSSSGSAALGASLLLLASCAAGEGDEIAGSFSASFSASNTMMGDGDGDESSGDGDGDTNPGDGDGDTGPGDGDGDTGPGDGDGDTGPGDGDGDGDVVDPCIEICEGKVDSTPDSCDAPYIIGRTWAKEGFFYGGNTQAATNKDTERCGPHSDPDNLDTGKDHFFRIYLVVGDTIMASQNPASWEARLKIHDEADCVGSAKQCSTEVDPAVIEYEALETGWFTLVVDGVSLGLDDYGDYSLTVDLIAGPGVDECACP
jgi:hypothetical protein